jgi:hypothetical protein
MNEPKEQLRQIHQTLSVDTQMCLNLLASPTVALDDTMKQFLRRSFVRAVFAHMEGVVFTMKQFAYEYRIQPETPATHAESAFLLEEAYELSEKGDIRTVPAKIPLTKNIKFAFKAFSRAGHSDYKLPVGTAGWEKLTKSIKIRDRLMHPKNPNDTVVTETEHNTVLQTSRWFMDCATECFSNVKELVQYEVTYHPSRDEKMHNTEE